MSVFYNIVEASPTVHLYVHVFYNILVCLLIWRQALHSVKYVHLYVHVFYNILACGGKPYTQLNMYIYMCMYSQYPGLWRQALHSVKYVHLYVLYMYSTISCVCIYMCISLEASPDLPAQSYNLYTCIVYM